MKEVISSNGTAIAIRGLRKHFRGFDLGPLDLSVPKGSIYGFVGPNGAGKTVTIDLLFGMGRPDAGTIHINGLDRAQNEVAIKKRAAYVGPELDYGAWGQVGKALRFVRGFYPDTWDDEYCVKLLDLFGLRTQNRIASLSFGSRTKLSIVMALARRPEILVLDEPTTGLDAIAKRELFTQLLDLVRDTDRTILISSHSLSDVERFADRLGIINNGLMLHEGPTHEIVDRYCLVDFSLPAATALPPLEGMTLIRREGGRYRVLADRQSSAIPELNSRGISNLTESPVTLEDLFVSLLKPGTPRPHAS